jgi:hypothetical protein
VELYVKYCKKIKNIIPGLHELVFLVDLPEYNYQDDLKRLEGKKQIYKKQLEKMKMQKHL